MNVRDVYYEIYRIFDNYQNVILTPTGERKIEAQITPIVQKLNEDEYLELYGMLGSPFMDKIVSNARYNKPPEIKLPENYTYNANINEDEDDDLHKKQVEFFFKKDKENSKCDCGAAYTSTPGIHAEYCKVIKFKNGVNDILDPFWD